MTTPVRSKTVTIAGECRTYRTAATVAPEKDSGGALLLRRGLYHLAITRMTPKNDTKFEPFLPETKCGATKALLDAFPTDAATKHQLDLFSIQCGNAMKLNPEGRFPIGDQGRGRWRRERLGYLAHREGVDRAVRCAQGSCDRTAPEMRCLEVKSDQLCVGFFRDRSVDEATSC